MKRIKKGFTLIELTLSIAIIMSMMAMYKFTYRGFHNLLNKVDILKCNNSVLEFINFSKRYCRENDALGKVYFSKGENSMMLIIGGRNVKKYKLPSGFKITFINATNSVLNVNKLGQSSDGCTMKYKDRNNNEQTITVSVGTGYVQIK
ncbi:hypothetical protein GCM10008905_16950 [Clostridium malenominatum]|uniref:Prepilin-type N-terminal cleavage/methylation domain-containing protein n=1 Tax=Clostridium malenominatum TaxID=1539 RepID=A0ABN1IYQ0_9CLOT